MYVLNFWKVQERTEPSGKPSSFRNNRIMVSHKATIPIMQLHNATIIVTTEKGGNHLSDMMRC